MERLLSAVRGFHGVSGGVDPRAGPEQRRGLNGRERQPGDGSLNKCFSPLFVPPLILWRAAECEQQCEMFDGGSGLVVMRGSHLAVNGRFGGKRSPNSVCRCVDLSVPYS